MRTRICYGRRCWRLRTRRPTSLAFSPPWPPPFWAADYTYSLFPRPVPREHEVLEKEPEGAASRGRLIPFGRHAGRILDTGCSFAAHREEHSAPTARAGDELLRPYRAPPTDHGRGSQLPATS